MTPGAALPGVPPRKLCFERRHPQRRGLPTEEVQLTRDSAANVAVAPVRWLVALAALRGTQGSPLLAAQAAAASGEGRGVGAPQRPAHGLAGFTDGCCRDTTERCCGGREKWVPMPDRS